MGIRVIVRIQKKESSKSTLGFWQRCIACINKLIENNEMQDAI
jgi:hypothetical protein